VKTGRGRALNPAATEKVGKKVQGEKALPGTDITRLQAGSLVQTRLKIPTMRRPEHYFEEKKIRRSDGFTKKKDC